MVNVVGVAVATAAIVAFIAVVIAVVIACCCCCRWYRWCFNCCCFLLWKYKGGAFLLEMTLETRLHHTNEMMCLTEQCYILSRDWCSREEFEWFNIDRNFNPHNPTASPQTIQGDKKSSVEKPAEKWSMSINDEKNQKDSLGPVWLFPSRLSSSLPLSCFCCCLSFLFYLTKTLSVESVRLFVCLFVFHRLSSIDEYIFQILFLIKSHVESWLTDLDTAQ